jgi:uncharacterized surface protein with fasciclin (FAS1) repeats
MIRKTIAGFVAAAAVAAPLALAAPAQAADPIGDGDPYNFDIVTAAIAATDADVILGGLDSYTAFLPNDRAFEVLAKSKGLLGSDYRYGATVEEQTVFDALVAELGVDTIEAVLLYHVVAGETITGGDVLAGKRIKTLDMANGQKLTVYVVSKTAPFIVLGDQDGRFFNDYVVKSKIDFGYKPGDKVVVHGISDVLIPKL